MRFSMKSLVALLMFAVPASVRALNTPVPFAAAEFVDPYSTNPDDALLGITVETACPNSLTITVTVPGNPGVGNLPGWFTGTGIPNQYLVGNYNGALSGSFVDVVFNPDTSSVWTFTDFDNIVTLGLNTYRIIVDIDDLTFLGADPTFQINPPNNLLVQVQLDSASNPGSFTADQTDATCKGPGGLNGDPQFAGFQGQNFQFHGMADEVFSLISTPTFQMNGNFKYLSSGKCDYNETVCFSHPGTYVDQVGFTVGETKIKAVSGAHQDGMRVWVNDVEVHRSSHHMSVAIANSTETGSLKYDERGHLHLDVPQFSIELVNSDYFFNLEVALKDTDILRMGHRKTKLSEPVLCKASGMKSSDRLARVEEHMSKHYAHVPMHGLIGQTWRNAVICDHAWVGEASDYVTSGLFVADSAFNYFVTL